MPDINKCQELLIDLADKQGYLTFDDIIELSDVFSLSVSQVDKVSEAIQLRGIIVYESAPKLIGNNDDLEDYSRSDYETVFSEIISLSDNLKPLVEDIKQLPPPQYGEIGILTAQISEGNKYARERLILLYLRNALKIALSMTKQYDLDIEDAVSAGITGLINAVDRYDPNSFSVFPSYASMWIQQSIQRDCNPSWVEYYFPAHYKTNLFRINLLYSELIETGEWKEPYDYELLKKIALETNLDTEQVANYIDTLLEQKNKLYLADLAEQNEDESFEYSLHVEADIDPVFDSATENFRREVIAEVLSTLRERESSVLRKRYGFDNDIPMTLEEVGTICGITRERVRQIEAKALRKLQHPPRSKRLIEFY